MGLDTLFSEVHGWGFDPARGLILAIKVDDAVERWVFLGDSVGRACFSALQIVGVL